MKTIHAQGVVVSLLLLYVLMTSQIKFFSVSSNMSRRLPSEADGCYHVFLDVGANVGIHGRFVFEPEKFPHANKSRSVFDEVFGTSRDNRDICCFEFEPNPLHQTELKRKSEAYKKVGWRYHVMHMGASDHDGAIDFYHQGDEKYNEWGFSLKKLSNDATKVSVPVIRFSTWVEREVNRRLIPSSPFATYIGPKVVMKMDIEGSEYVVLPDLLVSGAICGIDHIFGEFHPHFTPLNFTGMNVPLRNRTDASRLTDALRLALSSSRQCETVFQYLDDEAYLIDATPLPGM